MKNLITRIKEVMVMHYKISMYSFFIALFFFAQITLVKSQSFSKEELTEIFKKAENGNKDCQAYVGFCFLENAKNFPAAVEWLEKAANQGHINSQFYLGKIYCTKESGLQDFNKAIKWFTKAASQGNSGSQYSLGIIYDSNQIGPQDYNKAVKWYKKAAIQGHMEAQYYLGLCYMKGKGVTESFIMAEMWVKKAANQGYEPAIKILKIVELMSKIDKLNDTLNQMESSIGKD